jgi:hypothetical protein
LLLNATIFFFSWIHFLEKKSIAVQEAGKEMALFSFGNMQAGKRGFFLFLFFFFLVGRNSTATYPKDCTTRKASDWPWSRLTKRKPECETARKWTSGFCLPPCITITETKQN